MYSGRRSNSALDRWKKKCAAELERKQYGTAEQAIDRLLCLGKGIDHPDFEPFISLFTRERVERIIKRLLADYAEEAAREENHG